MCFTANKTALARRLLRENLGMPSVLPVTNAERTTNVPRFQSTPKIHCVNFNKLHELPVHFIFLYFVKQY